jgi:hypothetical protein
VIVDSSPVAADLRVPDGFAKLYDSGDGMVLLQRTHSQ